MKQVTQTIKSFGFLVHHGPSFQRARGADARDYGEW